MPCCYFSPGPRQVDQCNGLIHLWYFFHYCYNSFDRAGRKTRGIRRSAFSNALSGDLHLHLP